MPPLNSVAEWISLQRGVMSKGVVFTTTLIEISGFNSLPGHVVVVASLDKTLHDNCLSEVESSRTSLASRTSSRTHFEVLGLGLEGQVHGLGLEASSPRKLPCSRLEDSTSF